MGTSVMKQSVDPYFSADSERHLSSGVRLMARDAVVLDVVYRPRIVSTTMVRRHGGWFGGSEFAWTSTPVAHTDIRTIEDRDVWVRYESGQELKADIPAELDLREGQSIELLYAVQSRGGEMSAEVVGVLNRSSARYVVHAQNCELAVLGRVGVVNWKQVWNGSLMSLSGASLVLTAVVTGLVYWLISTGDYELTRMLFPSLPALWLDAVTWAEAGLVAASWWYASRRKAARAGRVRAFIEQVRQRYV